GVRKEIINAAIREISALESERKELSEQIRSIKNKKIKGDLNMKITDFNVAKRLYELEGDNRDELLSTIQETFDALGIGDQLDFIAAMERTATPPSDGTDDNVVDMPN
ncbi:MAG: hypothetical protein GY835_18455, partial [bacterium]|nr:hypothetical protein [bacterium]